MINSFIIVGGVLYGLGILTGMEPAIVIDKARYILYHQGKDPNPTDLDPNNQNWLDPEFRRQYYRTHKIDSLKKLFFPYWIFHALNRISTKLSRLYIFLGVLSCALLLSGAICIFIGLTKMSNKTPSPKSPINRSRYLQDYYKKHIFRATTFQASIAQKHSFFILKLEFAINNYDITPLRVIKA